MSSGNPVYVEGADIGFNNGANEIWPYFGASYLADGNALGNVSSVAGATGTFAEGLSFGYLYNEGPDSYVDELGAAGGQVLLLDQTGIGRAVVRATATYRSVLSSVIAGALQDSDRGEFITACASYLVEGLGIAGPSSVAPRRLTLRPSLVPANGAIRFPRALAATAALYDAGGRLLMVLPAGMIELPCASLAAGTYFVRADGAALSFTVLR